MTLCSSAVVLTDALPPLRFLFAIRHLLQHISSLLHEKEISGWATGGDECVQKLERGSDSFFIVLKIALVRVSIARKRYH